MHLNKNNSQLNCCIYTIYVNMIVLNVMEYQQVVLGGVLSSVLIVSMIQIILSSSGGTSLLTTSSGK